MEAGFADKTDIVFDLDSVAVVLTRGGEYLLQHREDRTEIAYPGWWGLFGGAREGSESAEQAIRREIREELAVDLPSCRLMMSCSYHLAFEGRRTRKTFFSAVLEPPHVDALVLGEGQGMAWFGFQEILAIGERIVPYDLGFIALHHKLSAPN